MFRRNSRYRKLADMSSLKPGGEWISCKELRVIPPTEGQFRHTVSDNDRLDLLAYKYYGDPTKWWHICDANPEFSYPTDLIDGKPIISETYTLRPADFRSRFEQLVKDLEDLTGVIEIIIPGPETFEGDMSQDEPDFTGSSLIVKYDPASDVRNDIIAGINNEFRYLGSFAWIENAVTVEAFTFDDRTLKESWSRLSGIIDGHEGILEVRSSIMDKTLMIVYNSAVIEKETVLSLIRGNGFEPDIILAPVREGSSIMLPPNRIL